MTHLTPVRISTSQTEQACRHRFHPYIGFGHSIQHVSASQRPDILRAKFSVIRDRVITED